jgi:ABC-type lipoprotein export system ATPase subunit
LIALDASGIARRVLLPSKETLQILDGVDLSVSEGESVAIVGRSGSGKTTLLSILGLLAPCDAGYLHVGGTAVEHLSDRRRARLRNESIGFIFQNYSLAHHLSAGENVELPLLYGSATSRAERQRLVGRALELVGLSDRVGARPRQLSGGEQQRVAIARALVRSPAIVLADEPTGALDGTTASAVLRALLDSITHTGVALVLVTHDEGVASTLSRQVALEEGVIATHRAGVVAWETRALSP